LWFYDRLDHVPVDFRQLPVTRSGQHALMRADLCTKRRDRDSELSARSINQSPIRSRRRRCLSSVAVGAQERQQGAGFRFGKDVRPTHGQRFVYGQPSPTMFFAGALNSVSLASAPQRLASVFWLDPKARHCALTV
jgi:hypothetical protein